MRVTRGVILDEMKRTILIGVLAIALSAAGFLAYAYLWGDCTREMSPEDVEKLTSGSGTEKSFADF